MTCPEGLEMCPGCPAQAILGTGPVTMTEVECRMPGVVTLPSGRRIAEDDAKSQNAHAHQLPSDERVSTNVIASEDGQASVSLQARGEDMDNGGVHRAFEVCSGLVVVRAGLFLLRRQRICGAILDLARRTNLRAATVTDQQRPMADLVLVMAEHPDNVSVSRQ